MKAAILTVSDTRSETDDLSGDRLSELLTDFGVEIMERRIATDDLEHLRQTLYALAEREDIDLIFTTGGTGFGPRDNTPEATRAVIDREAPGLAEAMRSQTSRDNPMAMLSRGICGIREKTLIVNLPGSPKAVEECFAIIRPVLRHAIAIITGSNGSHTP
ncbi:MAG: MogA/MoaB family molybdenum cofactor biosynthesis protein [Pyrinomonadaceae bacterium]